jgi:parallel beta-helix repeat protein
MSRLPPAGSARDRRQRRLWLRLAAAALAAVAILAVVASLVAIESLGVSPRLLAPYVERRSSGHHPMIEGTGRRIAAGLLWLDRGRVEPRLTWPTWAQPSLVPAPHHAGREIPIASAEQLLQALDRAEPGDVLTIIPGTYRFSGRSLGAGRPGRADAPITVRAPQPGSVRLEFDLLEGFLVSAPHWVFENLRIVGVCGTDDDCEHAFHVVGAGQHVVIRNNDVAEFNAHVKVNGHGGAFPDHGRLLGNRLVNERPRRTGNPVTPFDLVAASDWLVEGNLIADFVKDGGDFTSYGAFAKGGGSGTRFVRNVVLCEHRLRGAAGKRIGLSFGGGGTGAAACRDGRCVVEHERGVLRDNLIASCSDVGIYVNRSAQTEILHNTLLDTTGIQIRFAESTVQVDGNLVDGPLRVHAGALLRAGDNRSDWLVLRYLGLAGLRGLFADAAALDLRWRAAPPTRASTATENAPDLCGRARGQPAVYGAFEDLGHCAAR